MSPDGLGAKSPISEDSQPDLLVSFSVQKLRVITEAMLGFSGNMGPRSFLSRVRILCTSMAMSPLL